MEDNHRKSGPKNEKRWSLNEETEKKGEKRK